MTKRHIPRKRFGQHFLADRAILDRIVEAIHPVAEDIFLEIGPGEGVLTARILAAVQRLEFLRSWMSSARSSME